MVQPNDPTGGAVRSGGTVVSGQQATQPGTGLDTTAAGSTPPGGLETQAGSTDAYGDGDATMAGGSATPPRPRAAPAPGSKIGAFVVHRTLGSGAMGIVLLATDPELARPVAIKVLWSGASRDGQQRLVREAQATARLSHPNVVAVHQAGTWEGQVFIVMEYVDGGTLRQWFGQQARPWREVLAAFEQAGRGLAAAHAQGLVHRDFKPDNVLVGRDGRVRVSDFGLVGIAGGMAPPTLASDQQSSLDVGITRTGALLGTPAYMAPEQFDGASVDARADQFAFAVALFEALYGRRPFSGDTPANLLFAAMGGHILVPPPSKIPAATHAAIVRALAADPSARHPSIHAMLKAVTAPLAITGGGNARIVASVGAAAVIVAGATALALTQPWVDASAVPEPADVALTANLPSCGQAGDAIGSVWDDEARAAVRAQMQDAAPHLEAAPARLVAGLDRYAQAWTKLATTGCTAHTVDASLTAQEFTFQTECLDDRRLELDTLLQVLREGDAGLVLGADHFVERIAPIEACNDLGALRSLASSPGSVEDRDVRRQRILAVLQMGAGQYTTAFETAVAGVDLARERGGQLSLARLLVVASQAAQPVRRLGQAEALSSEALRVAAQLRAHQLEAEAALIHLQSVYGRSIQGPVFSGTGAGAGKLIEANGMLASVQAAVGRSGRADHVPRLLLQEANLAYAGSDIQAATAQADAAVAALTNRAIFGADLARAHIVRGTIAIAEGDVARTTAEFATARGLLAPLPSDHRTEQGSMLFAEGLVLLQSHPSVGAPEKLGESARIFGAIDPQHPELRRINTVLGTTLSQHGDHAGAFEALSNALVNARLQPAPDALVLLEIIQFLGPAAIQLGRWEDATRITEEGAELVGATYGIESEYLAGFDNQRAFILQAQGKFDASLTHLHKALDRFLARVGSLNPRTREPLMVLASTYAYLDRCAEAEPHITAIETIDARTEAAPDSVAVRLRLVRAMCALASGNAREAEAELKAARTMTRGLDTVGTESAFAAYVAAKINVDAGRFEDARAEATVAHKGFGSLGPAFAVFARDAETLAKSMPATP